jgi:hypothetical protein
MINQSNIIIQLFNDFFTIRIKKIKNNINIERKTIIIRNVAFVKMSNHLNFTLINCLIITASFRLYIYRFRILFISISIFISKRWFFFCITVFKTNLTLHSSKWVNLTIFLKIPWVRIMIFVTENPNTKLTQYIF